MLYIYYITYVCLIFRIWYTYVFFNYIPKCKMDSFKRALYIHSTFKRLYNDLSYFILILAFIINNLVFHSGLVFHQSINFL